jgi:uncharacterized protein (DUF362 family)
MATEARRDFILRTLATGAYAAVYSVTGKAQTPRGLPGAYPGRVVAVNRPGAVVDRKYQRDAIRSMMQKGMMELTGAPSPQDAWKRFFEPGDVVGVKLNPVGRPFVISAPEVFLEIVEGLKMAGVPMKNIVAYDRYRVEFLEAGFDKWLPDGVRWTYASERFNSHPLQLDMEGYDANQYIEMPLVLPDADPKNPHHRRSYLSNFISKDVNKMINLCLVKHHQSAGVTVALKNMSHGLVNNVSRSHSSPTLNTCGTFIPTVVDHPIIRQKVVLNICDGVLAAYHGGPGGKVGKYMWPHDTMYFATDPVALDKTALKVIDAKRAEVGMLSIAKAKPDKDSTFLNMQVEHIEIAGALGLGTYEDKKIDVRRFSLS